jgi:hypothetical protein
MQKWPNVALKHQKLSSAATINLKPGLMESIIKEVVHLTINQSRPKVERLLN